ncbi:acyltransferase family protein [Gryllotalpicola koreensis]|uniref:Acyltransferase family protein n=1 Tax=Gryllotalpicola koreensis TaxID=993086 RepID=A0ABP7ZPG1_9MICO
MTTDTRSDQLSGAAEGNAATAPHRRLDIQGLRAIAVGGVLLYHGHVTQVRGGFAGVDVFFVISGFLISSQLLRSLEANGRIDLGQFYSRRARRILPASFAVLIATVVAGWFLLPALPAYSLLRDAIATALYIPNYLFAVQGTDYLHATAPPSLFQHYWSLGVEEQFYLIWPLLLLVTFIVARRSRRSLCVVMSVVTALSFAACVVLSYTNQPWAFFGLPTRAWEFGFGGLLALAISSGWLRIPRVAAGALAWMGLAGLALVMFRLSDATVFPGYAALAPVLTTGAIIFGNSYGAGFSPARLLSLAPLAFLGEISYSLYLVHWPVLMIPAQLEAVHVIALSRPEQLALIVLCVPLAWISYRFVETPFRRRPRIARASPRTTLSVAGAASLVAVGCLVVGSGLAFRVPVDSGKPAQHEAASIAPLGTQYVPSNLTPALRTASQTVLLPEGCELYNAQTGLGGCRFGGDAAAPLVVLFGDSHASQWYPALHGLAEEGEIRLQTYTKSGCPSVNVTTTWNGEPYTLCDQWREQVISKIAELHPDLVLLGAYGQDHDRGDTEAWTAGIAKTAAALSFTRVALLVDTPDPNGSDVPTCLSAHLNDTAACAVDRNSAFEKLELQAASHAGIPAVDVDDYLCTGTTCPPVIGNILVYRDGSHITAAMSAALADVVRPQILDLLKIPAVDK